MVRNEIIINQSIEADLFEALESRGVGRHFTKIPGVYGQGGQEPKMGNSVWPEENVIILIYSDEEESRSIRDAVAKVKEKFPAEGISHFTLSSS